ncbi:unnamed protein product [Camellia sinensis]
MDSVKGLRWRKQALQALKPIVTNTKPEIDNGGGGGGNTVEVEVEEPLSLAARLFHWPSFNVDIIVIMGCKTRIYPDVVKESLKHSVLRIPRFALLSNHTHTYTRHRALLVFQLYRTVSETNRLRIGFSPIRIGNRPLRT